MTNTVSITIGPEWTLESKQGPITCPHCKHSLQVGESLFCPHEKKAYEPAPAIGTPTLRCSEALGGYLCQRPRGHTGTHEHNRLQWNTIPPDPWVQYVPHASVQPPAPVSECPMCEAGVPFIDGTIPVKREGNKVEGQLGNALSDKRTETNK